MYRRTYFFVLAIICFSACKKSGVDKPVDSPSPNFGLEYMEVQENLFGADVYLYGNFGDSSAGSKVKVGNTIIDGRPNADGMVVSWMPYLIKINIGDPDDDTGAGYISVI